MMLDWNDYRRQLAAGVKQLGQLSPDTIRGYIELSSAGSKRNLLGPLMLSGIIRALRRRAPEAADTRRAVERACH